MTREQAVKVTKVLNDIEDFENLYDEISQAIAHVEGNFSPFVNEQLIPLMEAELKRRKTILENM